jgi:hydrogenase nickel incorporation protein HypB
MGATGMQVLLASQLTRANDEVAAANRRRLTKHGVALVNVVGSPGAGKTALLEATIARTSGMPRIGVIEGDVCTSRDGTRIAALGVEVVQLNTGGACHLDAGMVSRALDGLPLTGLDLVLVENVGNLICPAAFDLGENRRVVVLSVAEGDDKPGKYPAIFRSAHAVVVSKTDLLGHTGFNLASFEQDLRGISSGAQVFPLSALRGSGLDVWLAWICAVAGRHPSSAHAAGTVQGG